MSRVKPAPPRDADAVERVVLVAALVVLGVAWAAVAIANALAGGGSTGRIDAWALEALRSPGAPADPIGPDWLETAAVSITALGDIAALVLIALLALGWLLLHRRAAHAVVLLGAVGGGLALGTTLKSVIARERPSVVPHLVDVATPSFPSTHALLSAAVYLTLAAIAARSIEERRSRLHALGLAGSLTLLIGVSRVYLGVHRPSDVLAGWLVGVAWALASWEILRRMPYRNASPRDEDDGEAETTRRERGGG